MSEQENEGVSINFGLDSFKIIKYEFKDPKKEIDVENLGYKVQFRPEAKLAEGTFSVEFNIVGQIGREDPLVLGSIKTLTTYRLSNMDELVNDDGHIVLPKGLAVTLLSIALSTTRGALVAKSEGNILSNSILPLADPKEMYEASPLKGEIEIK